MALGLGILFGCLLSLFLPAVPPFFVFLLLLLSVAFFGWRRCWFCLGAALYLLSWHWTVWHHQQASLQLLQTAATHVEGRIATIPRYFDTSAQFELELLQGPAAGYRVQVRWYNAPEQLAAGQVWQLPVQLSAIRDEASRAGYSAQRQALIRQQLARASVRTEQPAMLLGNRIALRQRLYAQFWQATRSLDSQALLLALTFGERSFSQNLWQGLQHASLGHLMAISGLHIGLVFGWCCWLLLPLRWIGLDPIWQQRVRLLLALMAALVYAWLAGFAIPTVRALLALTLLVMYNWYLQRLTYHRFWLLLVALLLLWQPMWALSQSFWLSVVAVGFIFIYLWCFAPAGSGSWLRLKQLLGFHVFMTFCMIPVTLLFFGGFSLFALISNLLFVPWCSLVAIPALLMTALLQSMQPEWAAGLWPWMDKLFLPLLWWLEWAADQSWFWWQRPEMPFWLLLAAAMSLLMLLLVRRVAIALLVVLAFIPFFAAVQQPQGWRLHLLDVGAGQAIVLQYQQHALLYDAGPGWGDSSATERLILPYLRSVGIKQLHYLVLSQQQAGSLGHWPVLRQHYPGLQVYTDVPTAHHSKGCAQLPMQFYTAELVVLQDSTLHAAEQAPSCVILLEVEGWRILLPGAMRLADEQRLLRQYPELTVDMLLLSGQGRDTASGLDFLMQLRPRLALSSHGQRGRVPAPAAAVQLRLDALEIPLLSTAQLGTIQIAIAPDSVQIYSKRATRLPFWLDSMQLTAVPPSQRR
ncbi:DNA internalization-related competence protein ComEC/Rec2 [Alkalimonas sp. NCh-2]|uniref:DNA internalization-related competence protein ComEC/Rec2 n=1 Tax=Alkalimonas sp. NCh-2 TaxID=3144846 RepID=UPI0031F6DA88